MVVYVNSSCTTRRNLAYDVIGFCYRKLISLCDVNIYVSIRKLKTENANGWCLHSFDNNYEISIDETLDTKQFIKTLCHEMVHVKQSAKNELVEASSAKYCRMWKGIDCEHFKNVSLVPWEVEAYEIEKKLYDTFMETHNEKNQTIRRNIQRNNG